MTDKLNIKPCEFNSVVKKLRAFFDAKGFIEMHAQNRLSILAACEDTENMVPYNYNNMKWPLPQTGQMWLEIELLKNIMSDCKEIYPGLYCVTTSYRNEKNPIPDRHDLIFPMFEFEMHGDMNDMIELEKELLLYLGFKVPYLSFRAPFLQNDFPEGDYLDIAEKYGVKELEHEHETLLGQEYGSVFFLKNFPEYTSPFWNMARDTQTNLAKKVDVIINGIETIGSAQRSSDPVDMKNRFQTISGGEYSKLLYTEFSQERVEKELNDFLSLHFVTRSGGGIGLTRLIRAMRQLNLL